METCYIIMSQPPSGPSWHFKPKPDVVFTNRKQAKEYCDSKNESAIRNIYYIEKSKLFEED